VQARLFADGTVPDYATAAWYAQRERAPHLEQGAHTARLHTAAEFAGRDGRPVVDLGAGDGGLLSLLEVPCWGYDLQPSNIEGARERGVSVRLLDVVTDHRLIEWAPVAVCTEVLEHLLRPHAFVRLIAVHADVLVASSPAYETPESHYEHHLWCWDADGYHALLTDAGWRVEEHVIVDGFQVVRATR